MSYICHYDHEPELDIPLNCSQFTLMIIRQAWAAAHVTNGQGISIQQNSHFIAGAASEDAASEDAASEDAASEDAASEGAALEDAASEGAALEDAALEDAASEDAASEGAALEDAASEGAALEDAASEDAKNQSILTKDSYDKYWTAVAQLQWALASDRRICHSAVAANIASLRAHGELDGVSYAVRVLMAAMANKYPFLAQVDKPTLVQLLALGADMTATVGESPEFLEFVKKELQRVNLAEMLAL